MTSCRPMRRCTSIFPYSIFSPLLPPARPSALFPPAGRPFPAPLPISSKTTASLPGTRCLPPWFSWSCMENLDQHRFPALKRVLFAGEVFPAKYLRQLMMLLPDAAFFNLYGPTETNVITFQHCREPPDPGTEIFPSGSPAAGSAHLWFPSRAALQRTGRWESCMFQVPR